jgi:hypothetical protein
MKSTMLFGLYFAMFGCSVISMAQTKSNDVVSTFSDSDFCKEHGCKKTGETENESKGVKYVRTSFSLAQHKNTTVEIGTNPDGFVSLLFSKSSIEMKTDNLEELSKIIPVVIGKKVNYDVSRRCSPNNPTVPEALGIKLPIIAGEVLRFEINKIEFNISCILILKNMLDANDKSFPKLNVIVARKLE